MPVGRCTTDFVEPGVLERGPLITKIAMNK